MKIVPNVEQQILIIANELANLSNFSCIVAAIIADLKCQQVHPQIAVAFPDMNMRGRMVFDVDAHIVTMPLPVKNCYHAFVDLRRNGLVK